MRRTESSRRDRVAAAMVALAVNGLIAWALQVLLSPRSLKVEDEASLQVVFITPAPHRAAVIAPARQQATNASASRAINYPHQSEARPDATTPALPAEGMSARPMSAVYLQQARQWAQQQHRIAIMPADPLADRQVVLPERAGSRFRMTRQITVAGAIAMVGKTFGGANYSTDDCELIRGRIVGLVVAGDEQAVQQDLDYERRHCRPGAP